MKQNKTVKLLCLLLALAAVVILSGCKADPIDTTGTNAGNNAVLGPYKVATNAPTASPTPTPVPIILPNIVTPTPNYYAPYGQATPTQYIIGTATPYVIATATPTATPQSGVLKLGASGAEVRSLQTMLKKLNYLSGAVDGDFGAATDAAVKAFQKANGLNADGVAGPATLSKLTAMANATATPVTVYKLGSTGAVVRTIQSKLKTLGFYTGSVDGDFGAGTETAVKAFQRAYGLTSDGVVGNSTLTKLNSAKATARPTATPKPKATATPKINDNVYLRFGDSGSAVRTMQNRLISLGYLSGAATGNFDRATEAAVKAFQNRNVSYTDGVAGPMTLQKMYASSAKKASIASGIVGAKLQEGSEGAAVKALQTRLKALGFYTGPVDGKYGSGTVIAVRYFQRVNNITEDGVAGSGTITRMWSENVKDASNTTKKPNATATPSHTKIPVYQNVTPSPDGNYVILREGDKGDLVKKLQAALKAKGFYNGTVDGMYGYETTVAVLAYQATKGLARDGKAGPATQRYLFEGDFPAGA